MRDDLPLPRWVYIPGLGGEPDRETLERVKALVPTRFDQSVPADHAALLYGIALNNGNFFWECHEILESVWKAAPQGGRDRILLRALIQIANGNLKQVMNRPRAVGRLYGEALAELEEFFVRVSDHDGFAVRYPAKALVIQLSAAMANLSDPSPVMLLAHIEI